MPRRSIDVAFTKARVAVFVDGCFWHVCPVHATSPAANSEWWATKLATNRARDIATNEHLNKLGWRVVRIWEHEDPASAAERILEVVRPGTTVVITTLENQRSTRPPNREP
jgi:DNA mismatch endonuclease (patch repair protein)